MDYKVRYEPYRTSNHQILMSRGTSGSPHMTDPKTGCTAGLQQISLFSPSAPLPSRLLRPLEQQRLFGDPGCACLTKSQTRHFRHFANKRRPRLRKVDLAAVGYSDALVFWRGQKTTQVRHDVRLAFSSHRGPTVGFEDETKGDCFLPSFVFDATNHRVDQKHRFQHTLTFLKSELQGFFPFVIRRAVDVACPNRQKERVFSKCSMT